MSVSGGESGVSRLFRLRRSEINGWRAATACSLGSLLVLLICLGLQRSEERIWVLPGSGGLYAGPLERMDRSRAFFHETALVASQAALQWSASGVDLPELVSLYFTPGGAAQIDALLRERLPDLKARALSTKPLLHFVSEPVPDGEFRIVEVRGVLATNGQFSGRLIYEEPSFTLTLRFTRNPDLGVQGAYPWIVSDVRLRSPSAEST